MPLRADVYSTGGLLFSLSSPDYTVFLQRVVRLYITATFLEHLNAQVFNWSLARGQGHSTLTPLTGVQLLLPQNLMDLKNERFLAQEFKNELVGASVGMG